MNKFTQSVFQVVFPFYPFWVWFVLTFLNINLTRGIGLLWIPFVLHLILTRNNRVPKYLVFFLGFTIYNLLSVYFNDIKPTATSWPLYIISDSNLIACAIFFIIENTHFEEEFIRKMNRNILLVVLISLVVSLIQIKNPYFFFNMDADKEMAYIGEGRIYSIFSWINLNSLGVTFPVMIAILLNYYSTSNKYLLMILLSGIIIAFLTRERYVMLSTIVVFSQLFFNLRTKLSNKLFLTILLVISFMISIKMADRFGYKVSQVIDERIMEKEGEMGSAKARITSFYVFLVKFPEHPWVGVGPETKEDVVQLMEGIAPVIHVGYLSYLYYYGIIGAMLLFISLFLLLRMAWSIGRRHNFWGSFYGLFAFCIANATFVYFNLSEMGIILAVIYLRYYSDIQLSEETEEKQISESELRFDT